MDIHRNCFSLSQHSIYVLPSLVVSFVHLHSLIALILQSLDHTCETFSLQDLSVTDCTFAEKPRFPKANIPFKVNSMFPISLPRQSLWIGFQMGWWKAEVERL